MATKKPRLSLTRDQIQAGVGAELLALCQSMTEDGTLSKSEIIALRDWLAANRSSDLPSIDFLATTLERIIADGKVTKDERKELYKAIEKVLPPEARVDAVEQRKAVEAEEKAQVRAEREAQKQEERAEKDRNRPLASANFMVAGVHYEGRPAVISDYVSGDDRVFLARDPSNRYSRRAIEIRLKNGLQIGFVPEERACSLASLLDDGCPHTAYITKVLWGGRVPIPVVQAYVYRPEASVADLVWPADVPAKTVLPKVSVDRGSKSTGCLSSIVLALTLAVIGLLLVLRIGDGRH